MSWIKITRDNEVFNVPEQAFKDVYKAHGFVVVKEDSTRIKSEKPVELPKVETVKEKADVKTISSNRPSKK